MKLLFLPILVLSLMNPPGTGWIYSQEDSWKFVDEGLYISEFDSPQKSTSGDSKITIIKIDPKYYDFKLLSASENNRESRTVRGWAQKYGLVGAINAGMFQEDFLTNVGYMKNYDHVNNPSYNKNNTIFAFNPVDSTAKPAQIIDRTCQDFSRLSKKYHCFIQSIRMIGCDQSNVWNPQNQKWSMVVLGMDKDDNILFIFTQSPYSVHNFINILLELPISIYNAMYMEGGPKAALYFSANGIQLEKYGDFENVFMENSGTWAIPNVLGIVKKMAARTK